LDLNTVLCDLNGLAGGYLLPELVRDGRRRSWRREGLGLFLTLKTHDCVLIVYLHAIKEHTRFEVLLFICLQSDNMPNMK
jgi:hypothetical protein